MMVYARFWLAAGGVALVMTILYVVFARRQVTLTAGIAGFAWAYVALQARSVELLAETQDPVAVDLPGIQLLAGMLAFVSFVVVYLYQTGEYPPTPPAQETTA